MLGEGFEPSEPFRVTVLQTVAIVHSAIPADQTTFYKNNLFITTSWRIHLPVTINLMPVLVNSLWPTCRQNKFVVNSDKKTTNHKHKRSGFTLIEILIIVFIIAILGTILLTTSGTLSQRHNSNLQSRAAKVASKEIERLRNLNFASLPGTGSVTGDPDLSKLPSGTALRTVTNYQGSSQIKQVNVTVTWQVNGNDRQISMETLIYQYGI